MHFIFSKQFHITATCYAWRSKLPRLAECSRSIIIAYSNNKVISPLIFASHFLLFSLLSHFGTFPAAVPPPAWKLSPSVEPPWAEPRPENSMTLCRRRTSPAFRGRLNLQNTSAGARQLLWSAANLSCLPPLWSCLNKNESGWSWRHKELLDAAARLPSSAMYRGPAPMVAIWPR